jgi:hypothetical protein
MKKLIASNFELDLSNYPITSTDENPWFSDSFSSKITYPFEIPLTDELDIALGFVSRNTNFKTLYDVKYYEDNIIHDAVLEILEEQNGRLQVSYEYGLEEFPLWTKKLSELSLENFDLDGQSIYQHAKANVNKVWPEKNYSFPAIHTPLYTDQDEMWAYFEGLINNYQFGEFLENTFDSEEVISYNANIVQPFPAFMYVMETIASDAGYVLAGDILTDTTLHDNFIYSSKEYFKKREPLEIPVIKLKSLPDVISTDPDYGTYESVVILNQNGKYLVSGFFRTNAKLGNGAFRNIKLGTTTMFTNYHDGGTLLSPNIFNKVAVEFEIEITNASASNELTFRAESVHVAYLGAPFTDFNVFDFTVTLIAEYDNITDEPIATVQQATAIDLRKSVPDMTVGEFITIFKNWHNYEYNLLGNEMIFNKIQDNMDFENLTSLEEFEVKSKRRKFQQGMSFLLKFTDREESKFIYDEIYHDSKGFSTSGFTKKNDTNTIEINGLPLPLDNIRNFETASAFENSESKLYIVRYTGLSEGRNATLSPEPLLIPQIHETNHKKWFDFRINAMSFTILFSAFNNQVKDLNSKTKIFMYNKLHYIKTIIKTQASPDIVEVEIESESLK